jgi:hypothetical protein
MASGLNRAFPEGKTLEKNHNKMRRLRARAYVSFSFYFSRQEIRFQNNFRVIILENFEQNI